MHTYREVYAGEGKKAYSVGYFHIDGSDSSWRSNWSEVKRFESPEDAASYASFLNGGPRPS